MRNFSIRLRKALKSQKKLKFSKRTLGMKALLKCVETLRRDRAMPKDTGELIKKNPYIYVVSLFLVISRVWLLRQMPRFPRACYIYCLCVIITFFDVILTYIVYVILTYIDYIILTHLPCYYWQ